MAHTEPQQTLKGPAETKRTRRGYAVVAIQRRNLELTDVDVYYTLRAAKRAFLKLVAWPPWVLLSFDPRKGQGTGFNKLPVKEELKNALKAWRGHFGDEDEDDFVAEVKGVMCLLTPVFIGD